MEIERLNAEALQYNNKIIKTENKENIKRNRKKKEIKGII